MSVDFSRFREIFLEEAREHVAVLEAGLLRLETEAHDPELLNTILRTAHSVKGSSGTFGFTDVTRFTHVLEGLLDAMRAGEIRSAPPLVDLLLRSTDMLGQLVAAAGANEPVPEGMPAVLAALEAAHGDGAATEATTASRATRRTASTSRRATGIGRSCAR